VEWASIEETFAGAGDDGAGGVLLLGNGFSTNIWSAFGYSTLLEQSGLSGRARELFGSRTSFETVLAELATARKVVGVVAPDREQLLERLGGLADEVREALFQTVREVHPEANRLVAGVKPKGVFGLVGGHVEVLKQVAIYLRRYAKVFVTNYDLISYWAAVEGKVVDLFPGSNPFDEYQAEYWLGNDERPKIFFLHGALHLWRSLETNEEGKHTADVNTLLLDVIRSSIYSEDRVPLFISEGSSSEKLARISASPYLSFCGRALADAAAPLTVLGHALSDVDRHICEAIERHPNRKIAIGVWVGGSSPEAQEESLATQATKIRGQLAQCRDVVFFNSAEHSLTSSQMHCEWPVSE